MALEGNLKDFALSEILQLISVQQKGGLLQMTSDDEQAEIWFDKGRIIYADRLSEHLNEKIKEYLVNTHRLTPEIISRVDTASAQSRISFEKVLVSGGYLAADELVEISSFIIEEMIHDLFKWQEGTYRFEPDAVRPTSPADVSLKTEGLLMEGMRRIDEWPGILKKLPSPDMWIHSGTGSPDDYSLAEEEKKLIGIVEKGTRLSELVNQMGIGQFRAYETVCNLAEVDLLTISEPSVDKAEAEKRLKKRINFGKYIRPVVAFFVIVFLILASFTAILGARALLVQLGFAKVSNKEAKRANMAREIQAIQLALDVYLVTNFEYPENLQTLVDKKLLSSDQIKDDFKHKVYEYRLANGKKSYFLDSRYLTPRKYSPK